MLSCVLVVILCHQQLLFLFRQFPVAVAFAFHSINTMSTSINAPVPAGGATTAPANTNLSVADAKSTPRTSVTSSGAATPHGHKSSSGGIFHMLKKRFGQSVSSDPRHHTVDPEWDVSRNNFEKLSETLHKLRDHVNRCVLLYKLHTITIKLSNASYFKHTTTFSGHGSTQAAAWMNQHFITTCKLTCLIASIRLL
jgi:hypothetical protein